MNYLERAEILRQCRYVDEVLMDAPCWEFSPEFLEKNKIDFVAHDEAPYAATNGAVCYSLYFAKPQTVNWDREAPPG